MHPKKRRLTTAQILDEVESDLVEYVALLSSMTTQHMPQVSRVKTTLEHLQSVREMLQQTHLLDRVTHTVPTDMGFGSDEDQYPELFIHKDRWADEWVVWWDNGLKWIVVGALCVLIVGLQFI